VQLPRGRVEGAVIGDGDEGVKLAWVEVHLHSEAQLMDGKKRSLALTMARA
jgi:hypothetical protein